MMGDELYSNTVSVENKQDIESVENAVTQSGSFLGGDGRIDDGYRELTHESENAYLVIEDDVTTVHYAGEQDDRLERNLERALEDVAVYGEDQSQLSFDDILYDDDASGDVQEPVADVTLDFETENLGYESLF